MEESKIREYLRNEERVIRKEHQDDLTGLIQRFLKFTEQSHQADVSGSVPFEDFNKIKDLRGYLLRHPDKEMILGSCLHYLGDDAQIWWANRQ